MRDDSFCQENNIKTTVVCINLGTMHHRHYRQDDLQWVTLTRAYTRIVWLDDWIGRCTWICECCAAITGFLRNWQMNSHSLVRIGKWSRDSHCTEAGIKATTITVRCWVVWWKKTF